LLSFNRVSSTAERIGPTTVPDFGRTARGRLRLRLADPR
jgi:hypothetical protein